MAINENLQGVVNDLKTAKESIATNLSTGNLGIAPSDGLETIASQLIGKKVNNTSGVTAEAGHILSGKSIVNANGDTITGNIPTKAYVDLEVNGREVKVPAGYYASATSKLVPTGSISNPKIEINESGLITATNSISPGYISSTSISNTKQLGTYSAQTWTPTIYDQTIGKGAFLAGAQTIKGDANLKAENIKSGVSIFGVEGAYSALPITESGMLYSTTSNFPSSSVQGRIDSSITTISSIILRSTAISGNNGMILGVWNGANSSTFYGDAGIYTLNSITYSNGILTIQIDSPFFMGSYYTYIVGI